MSQTNNPTPEQVYRKFFAQIVQKGFETGTNQNSTQAEREARTQSLLETQEKMIAPHFMGYTENGMAYQAQAQFQGTPTKEQKFVVHTTTIYPSGRYHCTCGAFKRGAAHRQKRPCRHATALSRAGWQKYNALCPNPIKK